MKLEFGFGNTTQVVEVPEKNILEILEPNNVEVELKGEAAVDYALANPIGAPKLRDILQPGQKIAIVTSDITRPMPTAKVMPALLDEIYAGIGYTPEAGKKNEDITLVFALGSHRPHTEEEKQRLAGERAYNEIKVEDSTPDDCIHLGTTKRGTPVDISRTVAEADVRICLGNIEYHYFAGYSGGAKAIMPGVSTREAIQCNHRFMVSEDAYAGHLDGNPIREDIEEAAAICGVDYILNVVLDEHKKIIYAVAGDVTKAHREGTAFLDTLFLKKLDRQADIVLVSQGGAPKDLNLYQTQKALDNSKHAVREGGTIILIGSCKEGLGEHTFEEWMTKSESPEAMIERIGRDFQLGGHKAAAIAMVLKRAKIVLVSDLPDDFVKSIFLTPSHSVQEAFDEAMKEYGPEATVIAMPYGGSTLPKFVG